MFLDDYFLASEMIVFSLTDAFLSKWFGIRKYDSGISGKKLAQCYRPPAWCHNFLASFKIKPPNLILERLAMLITALQEEFPTTAK